MHACTLTVTVPDVDTGVQTVTGVVDRHGAPFVPALFLVHGNSPLNALTYASGASPNNVGFRVSIGTADETTQAAWAEGETSTLGAKVVTSGAGGTIGFLSHKGALAFGGDNRCSASISAVRSGEFDLTYLNNEDFGETFVVTVLGGDDLEWTVNRVGTGDTPTVATSFPATVFLTQTQVVLGSAPATGGGTATFFERGWAVRDGNSGVSGGQCGNQGGNTRQQRTDAHTIGGQAVSSWTDSLISLTGSGRPVYALLGGIQAAAGVLIQPSTPGEQTVVTGLHNRLVLFLTIGSVPEASLQTDRAEWSVGMSDGVRQAAYWTGEVTVGNNPPLQGARYLSDADAILSAVPAAGSTSFLARARVLGFHEANQSFTIDWTVADAVGRQVLWLALGDAESDAPDPDGVCLTAPPVVACLTPQTGPSSASCLTPLSAPPAAACYAAQSGPQSAACVDAQTTPPSAVCFETHDPEAVQVGLIAEDIQP